MAYDSETIEKKWEKIWEDEKTYRTDVWDFSRPKYYVLDMFPYPSGQGLHVGHVEGYSATDAVARFKRAQGYNVLHPIGFDSFGLPAEQYSIKNNKHPGQFTENNIQNFIRQLKRCGFSYDWDRVIRTSDPKYYKFTQAIFLKFYAKGLAYYAERPVNYCPMLGTVLANEEVINGKSERGGYPVIRIPMKQWLLKITAYADKLLDGLKELDWPESTMEMQRNWIGRSEGMDVDFKVKGSDRVITVFTTRVDTLYGCTYVVLAPESPLVDQIADPEAHAQIQAYRDQVAHKSDLERTALEKKKTGVYIGTTAINPVNGREVPVFIGDYVLASYGTGAVMGVPSADSRDYDFAKVHGLPIIPVIKGSEEAKGAVEGDGPHINSDMADGLNIAEAKKAVSDRLLALKAGHRTVSYKLRDWLFSRQRYWGEPIPVLHDKKSGAIVPLRFSDLPLTLPELDDYRPAGDGKPPLAKAKDWVNVTLDGKEYERETNTMPQWAGSSWYYARYIDPTNEKEIGDPKLLAHWLPVDLYVGGAEHAVLHLLYARFWHRFLYDEGIFKCDEPFKKLRHQGVILGPDGVRMSKSRGNTISPDDVIGQYGADALRLYELFKGPLDEGMPWNPQGPAGAHKFIERVYRLYVDDHFQSLWSDKENPALNPILNQTIKKVTDDYEALKFNTGIAAIMVLVNELYKAATLPVKALEVLAQLLAPATPHLSAELWETLGHKDRIDFAPWPKADLSKIVADEVLYVVEINGKLRAKIEWEKDADPASQARLKEEALKDPLVQKGLEGKKVVKVVFVLNKILNIVVK